LAWGGQPLAQDGAFVIERVEPMVFVETRADGQRINHQGVQAHVRARQALEPSAFHAFARRTVDAQLRSVAEQRGVNMIWVTFYTGQTTLPDGRVRHDTYRVIFLSRNGEWRELQRGQN
jgi:hypothetical protein